MEQATEEILGVTFDDNPEIKAVKATGGKPQRIFPFFAKDFRLNGWFGDDLYTYRGKCYEPLTDREIKRMVRKFYLDNELGDKWSVAKARELVEMVKVEPQTLEYNFDEYSNLTNFDNGVFNFDTRELVPHSVDYKFTYTLNINYNKYEVECPVFVKFLQGCFASKGNWDDGYIYDEAAYENILRMCGYLLYPQNTIEGLFILLGSGSNGKSVLMDTLQLFFPKKYVTGLSLNTISNEEGFQREKLIHSKINFCAEQKGGKINSEELKKVASGQGISVQRKFLTSKDFDSHTKILVNCNNMPYFNDTTHAIMRRLFIFNFKNQFLTDQEWEDNVNHEARRFFKKVEKDWLYEKIREEKGAILNLFLDALDRLRNDGWHFVRSQNMSDILDEYREGSDTLSTWLEDLYDVGVEGDFISLPGIYNKFSIWYDDNFSKRCPYSSVAMSKKVKEKYRINSIKKFETDRFGKRAKLTGFCLSEKKESSALEDLMNKEFEVDKPIQGTII